LPGISPELISSCPPPVVTVIARWAVELVAIAMVWGAPSLLVVSAYGPPGTLNSARPPRVLTVTDSGAAENVICTGPLPVVTTAVAALTRVAITGPLPVSARSGPVRPLI
jgi:hypothetical protein